eukprot:COSAG02_NODE_4589_length_5184_cov_87.214749_5_plen_206_part_00
MVACWPADLLARCRPTIDSTVLGAAGRMASPTLTSFAVRMLPSTPLTSSTSAFETPFLDGAERSALRRPSVPVGSPPRSRRSPLPPHSPRSPRSPHSPHSPHSQLPQFPNEYLGSGAPQASVYRTPAQHQSSAAKSPTGRAGRESLGPKLYYLEHQVTPPSNDIVAPASIFPKKNCCCVARTSVLIPTGWLDDCCYIPSDAEGTA